MERNRLSALWGGILIVAGTTIGAGMLALPVVTGAAGFLPSVVLFIAYWLYMLFTGFLILELHFSWPQHPNLISMARLTLGRIGGLFALLLYFFLLYTLTTAYLAGSGPIFSAFLEWMVGYSMPEKAAVLPLLLLFGGVVYGGAASIDRANRLLMCCLGAAYILMVVFLSPHIRMEYLARREWMQLGMAVSIVSTSFGFHIVIPSLSSHLKGDLKTIRKAMLIGSLIPLLVYISWDWLALGIVPLKGANGWIESYHLGLDGATVLGRALEDSRLALLSSFFSLCAIITSFLGVSLSLKDCLADTFRIEKTAKGRLLLCLLIFIPPLIMSLTDPRAFLDALEYAGAFGVVVLLALFPLLMAWQARYRLGRISPYRAPGGKWLLLAGIGCSFILIAFEVRKLW